MKTPRATLAATAIPLLLISLPLTAGELPFNAPATARAQESVQLLHRAARALGDLPAAPALPPRDRQISNLWIFPTADADTVFAQYDLSASGEGAAPTQHLTLLKLRGDRILEQRELTDARAYFVSDERPTPTLHWSAYIGTGHVSSTDHVSNSDHVVSSAGARDDVSSRRVGLAALDGANRHGNCGIEYQRHREQTAVVLKQAVRGRRCSLDIENRKRGTPLNPMGGKAPDETRRRDRGEDGG